MLHEPDDLSTWSEEEQEAYYNSLDKPVKPSAIDKRYETVRGDEVVTKPMSQWNEDVKQLREDLGAGEQDVEGFFNKAVEIVEANEQADDFPIDDEQWEADQELMDECPELDGWAEAKRLAKELDETRQFYEKNLGIRQECIDYWQAEVKRLEEAKDYDRYKKIIKDGICEFLGVLSTGNISVFAGSLANKLLRGKS